MVNEVMQAPFRPIPAAAAVHWREHGPTSMVVDHAFDALCHPIAAAESGAPAGDFTWQEHPWAGDACRRVPAWTHGVDARDRLQAQS